MFEATIEYMRGETVVEVSGELVPASGPFTGFWVLKWGDGHLCINSDFIVSVQGHIPEIFMVDVQKIERSKQMDQFMFEEEYQRMTKDGEPSEAFS